MRHLLTILAALLLCAAPAQAQQLKTVMVNTNGVLQFPTNFWQTNAGTNFQQFVATNNFAYSAPNLIFTTNRGQYILREQNVLNVLDQTNLGIDFPHVLLAVSNNLYAFERRVIVPGVTNALGIVYSNATQNFSNSTLLTFSNASYIPEAVYDSASGRIYAASVTGGVFAVAVSNNAISSFATNNIDLGGSIAQDDDHLYLGLSNVIQKLLKSNGATVASITNTNVSEIHALQVTPDKTKLIGTTAANPAKAFVVTLSNFSFASVATYSNTNAFTFTDDFAVDNSDAWMAAEAGGAIVRYNFAFNNFQELAGSGIFFSVAKNNDTIYAVGPHGAVSLSPNGSVFTEFFTTNALLNEIVFVGTNVFLTDYTSGGSLLKAQWNSKLTRMSSDQVAGAPAVTNITLSNTNIVTPLRPGALSERFAWLRVTPQESPGNINVGQFMDAGSTVRAVGDRIVVQNIGTNILNIRRTVLNTIVATLQPNQVFDAVATQMGTTATWFTNSIAAIGATWLTNTNVTNFRTAIGLGATNDVAFNSVDVTNAAATRTNIGLPLSALTNTSNVTMMLALSGSTNTNHPFSGTVSVVGTNNTNTLTFSNGILQSVQ